MIPLQSILSNTLVEIVRRQPASKERNTFAWQLAVGPGLARVTTVELSGGVLWVSAADARWAVEIERAREPVLQKMRHLLGPSEVATLKIRR
jgi:predicted nucleic acid-binding Zn ribbon protein